MKDEFTLEELASRIAALEKHQMETDRAIQGLEEKVKSASMGFPVDLFRI